MRLRFKKTLAAFLGCALLLSITTAPASYTSLSSQAASRPPVRGKHGMVASVSEIASQVGVDVMKRGGNAIDAAVAVGLALAIVWPSAGNIGGGGFMVIRLANGKATAIDYREMGPAAAHRNVYLDEKGEYIKESSTYGHKASGVPGTVAGMAYALEKYGTMKWAEVAEPARKLAADGFPVWHQLELTLKNASKELSRYPETKRIFLRDGRLYEEGESFRQPELAATFERLVKQGPREFYEGKTAQLIEASMKRAGQGKAWMTLEDLKNYKVIEREPAADDLSRARDHHDAAAVIGRHRHDRDAQHARKIQPQRDGLRLFASDARLSRGDAPRVCGSGGIPRRS